MQGFQQALEPYQIAWNAAWHQSDNNDDDNDNTQQTIVDLDDSSDEQGASLMMIRLAQRLLFCAYCELDGNQVDMVRQRLGQSLTI